MFDWYLSPADRFQYETDFKKYTKSDLVTLQDLDPLFQQSRISTADFLQIWQLIDIKFEHQIQKNQFVYFMHILVSKRRGWEVPVSLPLAIKEEFLRDTVRKSVYVRPHDNVNDVGKSMVKNYKELQEEYQLLQDTVNATLKEKELLQVKLKELEIAKVELSDMCEYYVKKGHGQQPVKNTVSEIEQMVQLLQQDYIRLLSLSQ